MRKYLFLIIALTLTSAKVYAEGKFACQLNGQDQDDAPCLVGNFSEDAKASFSNSSDLQELDKCKTLNTLITEMNEGFHSCRINIDHEIFKVILFKTAGFKNKEEDLNKIYGISCAAADNDQKANCLNNSVSGNKDLSSEA